MNVRQPEAFQDVEEVLLEEVDRDLEEDVVGREEDGVEDEVEEVVREVDVGMGEVGGEVEFLDWVCMVVIRILPIIRWPLGVRLLCKRHCIVYSGGLGWYCAYAIEDITRFMIRCLASLIPT
jgi:hypothetical protein